MSKFVMIICFSATILFSQTTKKQDVWEPFNYFVGSWQAYETRKEGIGKGERVYEFIMNEKYLYCKNKAIFELQEKNQTGEIHEDWTFLSYDNNRTTFIIRQFNSEGFVNQYVLDSLSTDSKTMRLLSESSENAPPGLRARLTFEIVNDNEFNEKFELAPQGKQFTTCIQNYWQRQK